jgi:hypothetical protein
MPKQRPSSRSPDAIPAVPRLRELCQSLALLEEILHGFSRRYWFHVKWRPGEQVGEMKTAEGNGWWAWFAKSGGAVLRGFDRDSPMSPLQRDGEPWPGLDVGLPEDLASAAKEPAFQTATFCLWCPKGGRWRPTPVKFPKGKDPDGSEHLLGMLDDDPSTYLEHAEWYYKKKLSRAAVEAIYRHRDLTPEAIVAVDPSARRRTAAIVEFAEKIGYPVASASSAKKAASRTAHAR